MVAVIALDIDLGRIHAFSTRDGRVCYKADALPFSALTTHDVVLAECWSPQMYFKNQDSRSLKSAKGELTNRLRACIYNSFVVGQLAEYLRWEGREDTLLVAPSTQWTRGFPEDVRQAMAGVSGDNHDIRECRTMLAFFKLHRKAWLPYEQYQRNLTRKKEDRYVHQASQP